MDVRATARADDRLARAQVRQETSDLAGQRRGPQGGACVRRDRRAERLRGQAGVSGPRHLPQDHRQPGACLWVDRGERALQAPTVLGQLPHHARVRHPARAVASQELRSEDHPGRGRDSCGWNGAGRGFLGASRGDNDVGTGTRPEVGDPRACLCPRAADDRHRHPARRTIDGSADQDRAVRSVARNVRPARGGAAPHSRLLLPGVVLLGGDRVGTHRPQVHDPRDIAVGRLHRQRRGAVAHHRDREAS